jgi:capsular polysaccharide biosynthesis protein
MELKEYLSILKKRVWTILAITIATISISTVYCLYIMAPVYEAKTTLIIGRASPSKDDKVGYDEILMYQQLVKTYAELAKSRLVVEETIMSLGLNMTYEYLLENLKVTPKDDSRILEIAVQDNDPQKASLLSNSLADVFLRKAKDIMQVDNVIVMDKSKVPKAPIRPKPLLYGIVLGLAGLLFSIGLVFLMEYLDNTLKTEGDVERELNISVLAVIPYASGKNERRV